MKKLIIAALLLSGMIAKAQKIVIVQDENGKQHYVRAVFVRDSSAGVFIGAGFGSLPVYKDRLNNQLYYRKINSYGNTTRVYLTKKDSIYIK